MKLDELQRKLLAAARANPPRDDVPYAFEKRIIAALRPSRLPDLAALWARALWRAAVPCLAVMVLFGMWTLIPTAADGANATAEGLSQHLEQTLLAAAEPTEEVQ
jgi:hypothetical protein